MQKIIVLILWLSLLTNSYSQISFEKGYFLKSGERIECYIKNIDWQYNPKNIKYTLPDKSSIKEVSVEEIEEFGIYGASRFVAAQVDIERSSENLNSLDLSDSLNLSNELLFLKVLVEGKANLLLYEDSEVKRFFFSLDQQSPEQLFYKVYQSATGRIERNDLFKQQLWENLKCGGISIPEIYKLEYKNEDLMDFFIKYNECENVDYINYLSKEKRKSFNLSLRPGINNSSLFTESKVSPFELDFGGKTNIRVGTEAEFILPFNKNKWSLIAEVVYQFYQAEGQADTGYNVEVDYSSLEFPLGIRYYVFLNDRDKIFFNGSFVPELVLNSRLVLPLFGEEKIRIASNFVFGAGYVFKDKFQLEARVGTNKELLSNSVFYNARYNSFSFIFGYLIISNN